MKTKTLREFQTPTVQAAVTAHEGVLLADPKAMYETSEQAPKILAEHPVYGRAMIVARNATGDWAPVVWDEANHKAVQSGPLDWKQAVVW